METLKYTDVLDETMRINELSNGLTCYIIPKKGYVEKQAIVCVNYGSVDSAFETEAGICETPVGIAHFLEHKLFEDETTSVFEEFTRLGAHVNAFTNYLNTAYYFNCIDNFSECLALLLTFTQTLRLTDESVEKEKPIIAQEINMYDDNPFWRLALNTQGAIYERCPVKDGIAGSVESIAQIDKDTLVKCFNTFYYPRNMALVCVGDVNSEHVYDMAERFVRPKTYKYLARVYGDEPATVKTPRVETSMQLSRPVFSIAFKDYMPCAGMGERISRTKILMDIIAGESSAFFNKLYEDGLVDGPFSLEYINSPFYGSAIFSASGPKPDVVADMLLAEIANLKRQGIEMERFGQIKNKHIGRFVRGFNNIDNIATGQADLFAKGIDLFDLMNCYKDCSQPHMMERLNQLFGADNYVLSIVCPTE